MKAFPIGTRVRVIRARFRSCKHYEGMEGIVASDLTECSRKFWWGTKRWFGQNVRVGGDRHSNFFPQPDQLEPIVPPQDEASNYSYTELMDRLKAGEVECV